MLNMFVNLLLLTRWPHYNDVDMLLREGTIAEDIGHIIHFVSLDALQHILNVDTLVIVEGGSHWILCCEVNIHPPDIKFVGRKVMKVRLFLFPNLFLESCNALIFVDVYIKDP